MHARQSFVLQFLPALIACGGCADLKRLQTAGFVTEFGAVSAKPTGLAEVKFVLDALDAADPPLSWTFWSGIPSNTTYQVPIPLSLRSVFLMPDHPHAHTLAH